MPNAHYSFRAFARLIASAIITRAAHAADAPLAAESKPADLKGHVEPCSATVIQQISTALHIDGLADKQAGEHQLLVAACKPWVAQPHSQVAVLIYSKPNVDTSEEVGAAVALLDDRRHQLLASYKGAIQADAATWPAYARIIVDTARYRLRTAQRAFAVRLDMGHSPKCADGGESDYLTHFMQHGQQLLPVNTDHWGSPMSRYRLITNLACGTSGHSTFEEDDANATISVLPSQHHGYHDLAITATAIRTSEDINVAGSKRTLATAQARQVVQNDGQHYPLDTRAALDAALDKLPAKRK